MRSKLFTHRPFSPFFSSSFPSPANFFLVDLHTIIIIIMIFNKNEYALWLAMSINVYHPPMLEVIFLFFFFFWGALLETTLNLPSLVFMEKFAKISVTFFVPSFPSEKRRAGPGWGKLVTYKTRSFFISKRRKKKPHSFPFPPFFLFFCHLTFTFCYVGDLNF